jgi:hypothetical protein
MPRNSSGTYSRVSPPGSGGYTAGTTIDPSIVNGEVNDLGTELTNSIDKGGRTTPTANLPMGGFRHTGVSNGSARNDYASVAQLQDGGALVGTATGSLGACTATLTPAITAYANGQRFRFKWDVDTVGASTLDIDSVGVKNLKKYVNDVLAPLNSKDIRDGTWVDVVFDSANDCFIVDFINSPFGSVRAAAVVSSTGSLLRGYNVTSISKVGTGSYNINISSTLGMDTTNPFLLGTGDGVIVMMYNNTPGVIHVDTKNTSGTPIDGDFYALVF